MKREQCSQEVNFRISFRASHSLTVPQNRQNEFQDICDIYHGHEYFLTTTFVTTKQDHDVSLSRGEAIGFLNRVIRERLHNQNLNTVLKSTSGEEIVKWCWEAIQQANPPASVTALNLEETQKNSFSIRSI